MSNLLRLVSNLGNMRGKIISAIFYVGFSVLGLAIATYYSIGWFVLLTTLRRLFFSDLVPPLYLYVSKKMVDPQFAKQEKRRISAESQNIWFRSYGIQTILLFLLSAIMIWKINLSILDIFSQVSQ